MQMLLQNIAIPVCLIAGVALLVFEVFMPGFGLPGLSGIALLVGGIVLAWNAHGALAGLGTTLVALAAAGLAVTLSLRSASRGRLSRSGLILGDSEGRDEGYSAVQDLSSFLGREGVAETFLRPSGIALIDGQRLDVVSEGAFIPRDARIRVTRVEGARMVVVQINP